MLETTMNTEFKPGTNLKGDMVTADWRFLLPTLEYENIGVIGIPPISTLSVLSKMSNNVFLIISESEKASAMEIFQTRQELANCSMMTFNETVGGVIQKDSLDLIVISESSLVRKLLKQSEYFLDLISLLNSNGILYFVIENPLRHLLYRKALSSFSEMGFYSHRIYYLAPPVGRMQSAVFLKEKELRRYLFSKISYNSTLKNLITKIAGILYGSYPRALVFCKSKNNTKETLPDYLLQIAEKTGLNISKYKWGLSAGGRYNAKKILFFLSHNQTSIPHILIKLTRSSEFNSRLENEYRILSFLKKNTILSENSFPEPLFIGYHQNLAVVGQSVIRGIPFKNQSNGTADSPIARKAIDWITQLGVNSLEENAVSTELVFENLIQLLERFRQIYSISQELQKFLYTQIKSIKKMSDFFPLVFQHGDPGYWNMILNDKMEIAVIDWEAGEPQGMPLWDLFYFIKTYGSWVARKSNGTTGSLESFRQLFLSKTELGNMLINATQHYCMRINLDTSFVEPLFYTCWMHRALKEATRLNLDALDDGHYFNLVNLVVKHRESLIL